MSRSDLPAEFTQKMHVLLGNAFDPFFSAMDAPSLHALRMNPLKHPGVHIPADSSRSACAAALRNCFPDAEFEPVPWCPEGFYFTPSDTFRPGLSPYHSAGACYIQEPSAMAAAVCLDPQPGEIILDLCAAPGGKSTQIAAAMHGEGLLIANEIIPSRAKILSENIERMGICNAIVTNESPQALTRHFPLFFDRILVDAPCSGEGMFRKNPEAVSEWSAENVSHCAARQDEILSAAAGMLKSGGTLVYSTCTFSPEENEGTLTRFLASHPDFYITDPPISDEKRLEYGFSRGKPEWYHGAPRDVCAAIRIFPHLTRGEGHFIAVLRRSDALPSDCSDDADTVFSTSLSRTGHKKSKAAAKGHRGKNEALRVNQMLSPLNGFMKENLRDPDLLRIEPDRIELFGSRIYLLPAALPSLDGIRVLRPGLHLGTIKKDRFEPAHALALALSEDCTAASYALTPEEAVRWTAGESLQVSQAAIRGWTLMTIGDFSLGWGKCANGTMKNHYPKGLRRPLR